MRQGETIINWDAIGAIGEIIGAVAVVVSISYLAVQIRSQIREARLTATRELSRDYRQVIVGLAGDKELFEIYQKAMRDYESLAENERARIHMAGFSPLFGVLEQQYLHMNHGNIDPVFLESIKSRMAEASGFPGIRMWWERNRDIYSQEFKDYVDGIYSMDKEDGES